VAARKCDVRGGCDKDLSQLREWASKLGDAVCLRSNARTSLLEYYSDGAMIRPEGVAANKGACQAWT